MLLRNSYFEVHRIMRGQPLLCAAIIISVFLFGAAGLSLLGLRHAASDAVVQQNQLRSSSKQALPKPVEPTSALSVSLQPFNSAQMVQALTDVADQTGLPLNEVSFTLDESNGQPFVRYRAAFNVIGKYQAVRRFINGVHAGLPDVALDSISCTRPAINAETLKCDLVFSAFYLRSANG